MPPTIPRTRPAAALARAESFCESLGIRAPIFLAPMAGACPPSLSIAVMRAGGLGACGALLMQPEAIRGWADEVRAHAGDAFQLNLWIPGAPPQRDADAEASVRAFLREWGPEVQAEAGDAATPDFGAQCEAMLEIRPPVISSIMGIYPPSFVQPMHTAGIRWFATATTVAESKAAAAAGADAIIAQGMEAGGHRGSFDPQEAGTRLVGLFSLLPAVTNAVAVPVIAAGGIVDGRGVAAALLLGASAVSVGTGFLRCQEANLPPAWADGLGRTLPEDTMLTRAFSGRLGRSIATRYVTAAAAPAAPSPAPYPVQRSLTRKMRGAALQENDLDGMQAWAGQSAWMARPVPAGEVLTSIWFEARALLRGETQ